jgi:hypothetical protein
MFVLAVQLDGCSDGVRNGAESDVDCGGTACPACPLDKTCRGPSDCLSGFCVHNKCVATVSVGIGDFQTGTPC